MAGITVQTSSYILTVHPAPGYKLKYHTSLEATQGEKINQTTSVGVKVIRDPDFVVNKPRTDLRNRVSAKEVGVVICLLVYVYVCWSVVQKTWPIAH